jgi:hypothetical protein
VNLFTLDVGVEDADIELKIGSELCDDEDVTGGVDDVVRGAGHLEIDDGDWIGCGRGCPMRMIRIDGLARLEGCVVFVCKRGRKEVDEVDI